MHAAGDDEYDHIKIINFIRQWSSQRPKPVANSEIISLISDLDKKLYSADSFLRPFIESDALLFKIENLISRLDVERVDVQPSSSSVLVICLAFLSPIDFDLLSLHSLLACISIE